MTFEAGLQGRERGAPGETGLKREEEPGQPLPGLTAG
jgi:hypothetical protein